MPRSSRDVTAEKEERPPLHHHPPITKTAMFKMPYHHIKGAFTAEESGEFPALCARMHCLRPDQA